VKAPYTLNTHTHTPTNSLYIVLKAPLNSNHNQPLSGLLHWTDKDINAGVQSRLEWTLPAITNERTNERSIDSVLNNILCCLRWTHLSPSPL